MLLFEVAETTLAERPDAAISILQRILDLNVRIGIDNFGAGLAPLNLLMQMPVDALKLDPRLSAASVLGGRQFAVLDSVLRLARSLNVRTIAQGIENPEQLEALAQLGCDFGQGLLLSDAVDPARAQVLAAHGFWRAPEEP